MMPPALSPRPPPAPRDASRSAEPAAPPIDYPYQGRLAGPTAEGLRHIQWQQASLSAAVGLCLASDLFVAPLFERTSGPAGLFPAAPFMAMGVIFGQGGALAVWLALGPGPFLRRLILHGSVAAIAYCAWLAGFVLSFSRGNGDYVIEGGVSVLLGLPMVSLAGQLPLWITRQAFGWRLIHDDGHYHSGVEQPLSLRDLFLATLIVAVALGLVRWLSFLPQQEHDGTGYWIAWAVGVVVSAALSAIAILPATAFLLGASSMRRGILLTAAYALAADAIMWLIVFIFHWNWPALTSPLSAFVWLSGTIAGLALALIAAGVAARCRGLRLQTRRH